MMQTPVKMPTCFCWALWSLLPLVCPTCTEFMVALPFSPISFCSLPPKPRQDEFNAFFDDIQKQYAALFGLDIVASVRRLGLITYRIAMILTTLRICDDGNISSTMVCNDADFRTALAMVNVLLQHTAKVFQTLPQQNPQSASDYEPELLRRQFLDAFPPSSTGKPTSALLKNWASLPKRPKIR